MRIKLKLALGLVFLFIIITALIVVGTYYTNKLSRDANQIIKDNYQSLEYCREMQKSIEQIHQQYLLNVILPESNEKNKSLFKDPSSAFNTFEKFLIAEEKNITEAGEKGAAESLKRKYEDYKKTFRTAMLSSSSKEDFIALTLKYNELKSNIVDIANINMNAMNTKSLKASKTGQHAVFYVPIIGALAFLISFTFLVNFPSTIGNPIIEITKKMKEIANKNYDERLEVTSRDELGEMATAFNTMAERLKEYDKSSIADLLTEKGRIESIVKNLNEGLILLDENYIVKIINPIAEELLGIKGSEYLEKSAADAAIHNDLFRELVKDLMSGKAQDSTALRITLENEENFFIKEIHKVKRSDPKVKTEEIAGFVISLRNVTEFKKLDLAKTNFISIISHELKTPISSINLSLKLLDDTRVGNLNEEQKKLVESIKGETHRLSNITKELLDISQVETGNIKLDINEVNPTDIINYTVEALKTQLEDKKIKLIKDFSNPLPGVRADLEKTVWVMTNLLANAIRYTPQNGKISIAVHPSLKDLYFIVEDTGPGIDPRYKDRIFQRFVQIEKNSTKREGVGLGLAIAKEFIQEQGGKIWVESELGIGSKFVFSLPQSL